MTVFRLRVVVCALLAVGLFAGGIEAQDPFRQTSTAEARDRQFRELAEQVAAFEQHANILKQAVALVKPSVVHIEAQKPETGVSRRAVEEAGSGVIVEHAGAHYVLTNRHVIRNAPLSRIKVKLTDGREVTPTRTWSDRETDVAVMSIDADGVVAARLGDSDQVEIGDFVLAVGSPFGLSHSVTYGIISAKGRRDLQLGTDGVRFQNFFQTDAAINPGNSGGPLLNLRAEIIGLNTAIASSSGGNEGIGFTIPINMVMSIAKQLIDNGDVARAFLGVLLDSEYNHAAALQIGLRGAPGARIKDITPNSAAEHAELKAGDVIVEFDGVRIENDEHLINQVSVTPVGKEVSILLYRDEKPLILKTRVRTREANGGEQKPK